MKLELQWLNGLWLILPLMGWNLFLGPRLSDERITSDDHSPKWLLMAENVMRLAVFVMPLLIPLRADDAFRKAGLVVYLLGTLVYFASWIPFVAAPQSKWKDSIPGLLAPRITPLFSFIGIALIGHSWTYCLIAVLFIILHTWHGIQNLQR